ncbi:MAG: hypothetical protein J7L50_02450, partial [Candidatus Odinarchaeota archaeon]|nr:hypothetical protein [Candidatus Odinarchaeota archaeon]
LRSQERVISPLFSEIALSVKARVSSIEDLLILKIEVWRERDIIDVCLLLLDSFEKIDIKSLSARLQEEKLHQRFVKILKSLLDMQGSRRFHEVWESFMGRKIRKQEERELWQRLNKLLEQLT